MKSFFVVFFSILWFTGLPQLPSGSIAPDFTIEDIEGETYNLYDILDQGKSVYLDMSTTWCQPCWNFHESKAFENLYNAYGPEGTDELMVFTIEVDPATNIDCITNDVDCNNSTFGDWTSGISYPICNNDTLEMLFNVGYYPTIFHICPDRIITELGPENADFLYSSVQSCFVPSVGKKVDLIDYQGFQGEFCGTEAFSPVLEIQNKGTETISTLVAEVRVNGEIQQTINWEGNIATYQFEKLYFNSITLDKDSEINFIITNINNSDFQDFSFLAEATLSPIEININLITLELKTDNAPEETFWTITNSENNIIYYHGNPKVIDSNLLPNSYLLKNHIYVHELILPDNDCYSFNIYDQFNDGICCSDGNGYYRVYDSGELLLEGGNFSGNEIRRFSLTDVQPVINNLDFISSINMPDVKCGETTFIPEVQVKNLGTNSVESILFEIKAGVDIISSVIWSGKIDPLQEELISFDPINILNYPEFEIHIVEVNEEKDSYELRNQHQFVITKTYTNYTEIEMNLQLDAYAYEVYWELINLKGEVLASGGNLQVGPDGGGKGGALPFDPGAYSSGELVNVTINLPTENSCYLIHIVDSNGDGIASNSNSFISLSDESGIFYEEDLSSNSFSNYEIPFETQGVSSTTTSGNLSKWTVFPNPSYGDFTLKNNSSTLEPWNLEIIDIRGNILLRSNVSDSSQLNISSLESGLYFVKLINDQHVDILPLIIQ